MDYYIPPRKLGDIKVSSIEVLYDNNITKYGFEASTAGATSNATTAFGYKTLKSVLQTGTENSGFGQYAGTIITTGDNNTAIGSLSYASLTTGSNNVGLGRYSGRSIIDGSDNIIIGSGAGYNGLQKTDAVNNIIIGKDVYSTENNIVKIGNSSITKVEFSDGNQATFSSDATDAATTQTLVNKIKDWMIDNKLMASS